MKSWTHLHCLNPLVTYSNFIELKDVQLYFVNKLYMKRRFEIKSAIFFVVFYSAVFKVNINFSKYIF